ncbi:MAG TPA: HAMP domain-containing sensor histidine kinase [Polyangiaceae bacterium]|nr:HAMP domain-containing sensor histidine kinase [Polyangiaceae bacterium]
MATTVLLAGAVTLIVSLALVVLTTQLHTISDEMAAAVESVPIAQSAKSDLLLYGHTTEPLAQSSIESRLQGALAGLHAHVGTRREREALERAETRVREYLVMAHAEPHAARTLELYAQAFGALDRLVSVNVAQTREDQAYAARWNRTAEAIGVGAITLLATMCGLVLWWLRERALRPLLALGSAMQRFGAGERGTRAEEAGPQELRVITRQFNDMAASIAAHREAMMALLGGVAHDLRTPLSALNMSLGMVRANEPLPAEPRLRQTLAIARRQAARLERMLADFLDFARIEASTLELRQEDCDLAQIAREVVALYETAEGEGRIEISCPKDPVLLNCDASRIEQVLGNLISNALKYSPSGALVNVTVGQSADSITLEVRDRGVGIALDEQRQVFEPFHRTRAGKARASGAGLGLFVVRTIVEAHGGTIALESTPGQGTTVTTRLPRVPLTRSEPEEPAQPLALH